MKTPSQDTPGPFGHLDAASWSALRDREPAAVAHFARHLASPCDACEGFLAEASGQEELDALADEALVAVANTPPREDTLGWERVRRRAFPSKARTWGPRLGALAAVAAALVLLVLAPRMERPGEPRGGERVKGGAPLVLELTAAAQLPDGRVLPVAEGQALPPEAVVLLRYHTTEAVEAVLVREVPAEAPRVLGRFSLEAGTHDLAEASGLAGVSLEGETGALTLALVALPPGPLTGGATGHDSGHEAPTLEQAAGWPGAVTARIHLRVQPGDDSPTGR
ncbi:hypothetical protein [Hyalangium gracile]|uniref:hypothetical protein n=1 Tax=Hyalangium gracile TaxID=394092 RepID=UPI001CCC9F7E|nr:hypothetical protein [Hyalangium gracile]